MIQLVPLSSSVPPAFISHTVLGMHTITVPPMRTRLAHSLRTRLAHTLRAARAVRGARPAYRTHARVPVRLYKRPLPCIFTHFLPDFLAWCLALPL